MSPVAPVISFVIPVRDDAAQLARCLAAISRASTPRLGVEVVVVDNGSGDDSIAVALEAGARVLTLPGLRLGELRNRGAAAARGRILAFVDADHEIDPGWVSAAIDVLRDTSIAAVGAPCHPPSPGTWVQRMYDGLRRHPTSREPVEWLGSGNMAVREIAFQAAGGFDTSLETCEDVDLCRRLRRRGHTIVSDSRLHNIHLGDPRTLRQVFFGELWRGRDNVRVSLRHPRSTRTMISAVIPVANLAVATTGVIGLLTGSVTGLTIAAIAALLLTLLITLRASLMLGRPWSADWPGALAVAAAYEAGRALAVAGRFGYRRRRTTPALGHR